MLEDFSAVNADIIGGLAMHKNHVSFHVGLLRRDFSTQSTFEEGSALVEALGHIVHDIVIGKS